MNGVKRNGLPLQLQSWPPVLSVVLTGLEIPDLVIPDLCPRHRPPLLLQPAHSTLQMLVFHAFRNLNATVLECGADPAKLAQAVKCASPLCCVIGDACVEALTRQVGPLWAMRS